MKHKEVEEAKELVVVAADYYFDTRKRFGEQSTEALFAHASLLDAVKQHRVAVVKALVPRRERTRWYEERAAKKKLKRARAK